VDVEDVVVVGAPVVEVEVVVEVGVAVVVVVVVARVPIIGRINSFVHTPFDTIFISVAAAGTNIDVYPATKDAFGTFTSKGEVNPLASEYKSKGPVSAPAITNVINTVCVIYYGLVVVVVDVVVQSAQSPEV
jgi:hypothetical protein